MGTSISLNTVFRNPTANTLFYGFLGLHGRSIAPQGTYTFVGDALAPIYRNSHSLAGLQNALTTGTIEILATPAMLITDLSSGAISQITATNGTLGVASPSWGAYNNILTGTFGAISTPTASAVASDTLVFNSAINALPYTAVTLTKNAGSNLITITQTPTTSDHITWTIPSLTALTGTAGTYILSVPINTGITDSYGNSLATALSVTWVHS